MEVDTYFAVADSGVVARPVLTKPVVMKPATAKELKSKEGKLSVGMTRLDSTFFYGHRQDALTACGAGPAVEADLSAGRWGGAKSVAAASLPVAGADTLSALPGASLSGGASASMSVEPLPLLSRGEPPLSNCTGAALATALLAVLVVGVTRVTSGPFYERLWSYLYDGLAWKRMEQQPSRQTRSSLLLANVLFYVALGVFICELLTLWVPGGLGLWSVGAVAGVIALCMAVYIALHNVADNVIGFAFEATRELRLQHLHRSATFALLGATFAPAVLLMPFVSTSSCNLLAYTALAVAAILLAVLVVKLLRLNLRDGASAFYFILYLCAVELAPLVCIVRLAVILTA